MEYPQEPADMPEPISSREGCKVGWRTYSTEQEAEKASAYWRKLASYKWSQGYDFGYQVPGAIRKVENGFEVTIP